jgi:hypothetical protein
MMIVQYIAAFSDAREPQRDEFATVEELLSLPWVADHKRLWKDSFVRFSLAYGDTLMMEFKERTGTGSFKVVGHIYDADTAALAELPVWGQPQDAPDSR